jgi:hypothetical protein
VVAKHAAAVSKPPVANGVIDQVTQTSDPFQLCGAAWSHALPLSLTTCLAEEAYMLAVAPAPGHAGAPRHRGATGAGQPAHSDLSYGGSDTPEAWQSLDPQDRKRH